jgi:mRNA interferase MazF
MLRRGELRWVDFGAAVGSGPDGDRPGVVISTNAANASRISTAIVAAVTSNVRLAVGKGNVFLPAGTGGLDRDSVINVSQVFTLDRSLIRSLIGTLPHTFVRQMDGGLRLMLDL